MTTQQPYRFLIQKHYRNSISTVCVLVLVLLTVGLDFYYAHVQKTSFYISESLLFSSFWILFIPLLNIQLKISKRIKNIYAGIVISIMMIIIHLFVYPAMVWLFSELFYDHTFPYVQSFNFGLTEHFIKLVIFYGLPIPVMVLYNNIYSEKAVREKERPTSTNFITSLIVSDSSNRKIVLDTKEIFYFSANSPYINIHHQTKKYLQTGTLKSLETSLDAALFIRIHRSCIVNISKVDSYISRQNGDYDLKLSDGTELRVSRNYSASFKAALDIYSRLTI